MASALGRSCVITTSTTNSADGLPSQASTGKATAQGPDAMCIKQSNSHSWQHPCTDWFQRLRPRSVLCLRALSRSVLCLRSPLLPLVLASTGFTLVFALAMSSFGRATQLLAKVERALHQRKIGLRQCHTFHASRKRGREGGREGERETRTKG